MAMPGVVCSAAIDDERLSCTADEDGRTHWRTWHYVETKTPPSQAEIKVSPQAR